jgi:hypothetical protein
MGLPSSARRRIWGRQASDGRRSRRPRPECLEDRLAPATYTVNRASDNNVAFITNGQLIK